MAARTRVYIDASAEQLEREIKKAERALERLGREGVENGRQAAKGMQTAEVATAKYARAAAGAATVTSRVGSAARTAAPYLGAGLALGLAKSVAEAREAEKALSQTEAVIKSTGGVAKVTADDVQELANSISLKSGIDDEAIQSGENLLLTFKNIRNEVGAGNDIFNQSTQVITDMSVALDQDLKSSAIQVGKALNDPTVGLTALQRVGVTFTEQTKEQITALVEQGDTLKAQKIILEELTSEFGGSAEAQADSFDKLKVSAENFAEEVGGRVTPVLGDMADELSDILSDDKLSSDEKMDRLGDFFTEWAGKGIDALEDAAPELAKAGGEVAIDMIEGFAGAWWDSDILGKLFLGAGAIRLFGGPGVFGKLGGSIGGYVLGGMNSTIAGPAGTQGAKLSGKTAGRAAGAGLLLGLALEGPAIARQIDEIITGTELGHTNREAFAAKIESYFGADEGSGDFFGKFKVRLQTEVGNLVFDSRTGKVVDAKGKLLKRAIGDSYADAFQVVERIKAGKIAEKVPFDELIDGFDKTGKKAKANGRIVDDYFDGLTRNFKLANRGAQGHETAVGRALSGIGGDLKGGSRDLQGYMEDFARSVDRGRDKSSDLRDGVGGNLLLMSAIGGTAIQTLVTNANRGLTGFGADKVDFQLAKDPNGKSLGRQSGGPALVPGNTLGDSFHTVVPTGSFILNGKASAAAMGFQAGGVPVVLEPGELVFPPEMVTPQLEAMNRMIPRFAKGGTASGGLNFALGPETVPPIMYDANHAGGNSHWHITGTTTPWVVAIGKQLQQMGFMVGEHPAFGGVNAQHSATGGHYDALAIDVNSAADETHEETVQVAALLRGKGTIDAGGISGALVEKLKRVVINGPDGPMKDQAQHSADAVWKAAKAHLNKEAGSSMDGAMSFPKGGSINAGSLPPALQKWNKRFPGAVLQNDPDKWASLTQMPFNVGAAIAEWAGMPGVTFAQMSQGEGGLRPGSMGDDNGDGSPDGYGWLAITRPYGDSYGVKQLGGYEGMLNPISNAIVAKRMYDTQGLSAWYGDRFVTDPNAHYTGPLLNRQKGGFAGMARGGKAGKKPYTPPMPNHIKGGKGSSPPLGIYGVPGFIKQDVNVGVVNPPKMSYEQQMTSFGIGLTIAEGTATTDDDLYVLQQQLALVQQETDATASQLANLSLTKEQREQAKKAALKQTASLEKELAKGGLTKKEKKQLDEARSQAAKQFGKGILDEERGELLDKLSGLTSELSSTQDAIENLGDTESIQDLVSAMQELTAAQQEQNRILTSEASVQRSELISAIADMISGQIGGRAIMAGSTAGYGSVVSA